MKFKISKSGNAEYAKVLYKRVQAIKLAFLKDVYQKLRLYTPVRSGRLRDGYQIDVMRFQIKNEVQYLWFVDLGTIHQRGQHFVQLSYNQSLRKLPGIIKNIENSIN